MGRRRGNIPGADDGRGTEAFADQSEGAKELAAAEADVQCAARGRAAVKVGSEGISTLVNWISAGAPYGEEAEKTGREW